MTLREKIAYLKETYPKIYAVVHSAAPNLLDNPENATEQEIAEYNFWIDCLPEDDAQQLYELS